MKRRQIISKFLWFWGKYKFNTTKPKLNFIDADGRFGSQCVDLIRQYCKEVYSYNMPTLDRARNLSSRQFPKDKRYEVEVGVDSFQMGDIVSVDLIPRNESGHIFIIYKQTKEGYWYIDQNGIGGAFRDGKVNNIKGNGVERRFSKRGEFKILKAFRYK